MNPDNIKFIGVTTSNSSIMKIFPKWSQFLGINANIMGIDIPLNAPINIYREALSSMVKDPKCRGALVTSHKISIYESSKDQFDYLDEFAKICGEISCIKIRNNKLEGFAKDPVSAGQAIEDFLPKNFFENSKEVLILGDGGAATAIAWYLASIKYKPNQIFILGKNSQRLDHLAKVMAGKDVLVITKIFSDKALNSLLSANKVELIVNATGMGKDIPGSPWPENLEFPVDSYIWELNYRGELDFLNQAKSQSYKRNLHVFDGWRYFIYGWTQVISEVFDIKITENLLLELEKIAASNR